MYPMKNCLIQHFITLSSIISSGNVHGVAPGRPVRQPPAYQEAVSSSKLSRPQGVSVGAATLLHSNNQNTCSMTSIAALPNTVVQHPLRGRPSSLKLVHSSHSVHGSVEALNSVTDNFIRTSPPSSTTSHLPSLMGHHQRRSSAGTVNTQLLQQSGMVIPKGENFLTLYNIYFRTITRLNDTTNNPNLEIYQAVFTQLKTVAIS